MDTRSLLSYTQLFLFSVKGSAVTEPPKSASVSRDGIIALGVVFGVFAVAMGTFIGYLIYREKRGKPSFAPNVSEKTFSFASVRVIPKEDLSLFNS